MPTKDNISERAKHVMNVLVEKHIHDGLPVGSKALKESSGLNVSSATIRSIMADLEKKGLLQSPHTSAGRIPTNKGYRLFVDNLLSVKSPVKNSEDELKENIKANVIAKTGQQSIVQSTSHFLSDMTNMASVIFTPQSKMLSLKHIEFLPLSAKRLLVVMVTSDDEIQNKIINTTDEFTISQLHQMGNYLNEQFSGQSISLVKSNLIKEMKSTRKNIDQLMSQAINLAQNTFIESDDKVDDNLVYSGETNLMQYDEIANMEKMRQMFQAFHEKQKMIGMLNDVHSAHGVQIYIGKESGYEPFSSCSIVAKSYKIDEDTIGVLGVIGPTRMSYNKIIPIVDITAKVLSSALNK